MQEYIDVVTQNGTLVLLADATVTMADDTQRVVRDLVIGDKIHVVRAGAAFAETISAMNPSELVMVSYEKDGQIFELVMSKMQQVLVLNDGKEDLKSAIYLMTGDNFQVTVGNDHYSGVVTNVLDLETIEAAGEEDQEVAQERRIAQLESQVATLMTTLETTNNIVLGLQRTIVEMTAAHIDRLFSDPVMVDTLAQRFLIASANAIAHKVKTSRQRTPQLVVIEGQIPGCVLRARLNEEGSVEIEHQDKEGVWVGGDELPEDFRSEELRNTFGGLLLSYGAEVGRTYYITDDIARDEFREQAARQAKEHLDGVNQAAVTTH